MAAVRARRSVTHGGGGGRKSAPPSKPLPRLATLQMKSAMLAESFGQKRERSSAGWVASGVLVAGALIAGATFAGGSLVDARDRMGQIVDHAAADAGFRISEIKVEGVEGARADEVKAAVLADGRVSIFSASPRAVKQRVESLAFVQRARVARYWPGSVRVQVEHRRAVALWDNNGRVAVVDAQGAALRASPQRLPRVVGEGAGPTAALVLAALDERPALRTRLDTLVRVNDRRWDMRLKSGTTVALPAANVAAALDRLDRAERQWRLLERQLARIDLRDPERVVVLPKDVLAGGPGLPETAPVKRVPAAADA